MTRVLKELFSVIPGPDLFVRIACSGFVRWFARSSIGRVRLVEATSANLEKRPKSFAEGLRPGWCGGRRRSSSCLPLLLLLLAASPLNSLQFYPFAALPSSLQPPRPLCKPSPSVAAAAATTAGGCSSRSRGGSGSSGGGNDGIRVFPFLRSFRAGEGTAANRQRDRFPFSSKL